MSMVDRVSVIGCPGSGKSTLARQLAQRLGVDALELDSEFHQPGWTPRPADEFLDVVRRYTAGDQWVLDGNYRAVQPLVWEQADTVVWLDLPRPVVLGRLVPRTVHRVLTRQELWNGNRERVGNLTSLDPSRSIIAYAIRQHAAYLVRYAEAMADPAYSHVHWHRLTTSAQVREFLATA